MVTILQNPDFSDSAFVQLVELLRCHGGITYTEARASAHIRAAKRALQPFGESPVRGILEDIADYALFRKA
jgi:geranylgeranyl pyrophosphate synthase